MVRWTETTGTRTEADAIRFDLEGSGYYYSPRSKRKKKKSLARKEQNEPKQKLNWDRILSLSPAEFTEDKKAPHSSQKATSLMSNV